MSDHGALTGLTDADHPISAVQDLQTALDGKLSTVEATVTTVAATGASETLDLEAARVFRLTMDQNCTFTFANPDATLATGFTVILSGTFTPTWPASVVWPGGIEPTYTSPSVYTFFTHNAGTTYYGAQAGAGFA